MTNAKAEFKVELANKMDADGRAVGNLYGVALYLDGCRCNYILDPQGSEEAARAVAADPAINVRAMIDDARGFSRPTVARLAITMAKARLAQGLAL